MRGFLRMGLFFKFGQAVLEVFEFQCSSQKNGVFLNFRQDLDMFKGGTFAKEIQIYSDC